MTIDTTPTDLTLDPATPAAWHALRALAHRMVDDTFDHLAGLRDAPAWQPIPDAVRVALDEPVPREGIGAEAAYRDFVERVRPYPSGNLHPRFWGWVQGTGTPLAMMADMLASGLNAHLAGFDQAPALVEHRVIAWLADLLGFPAEASGLLVTGGSMASLLGLAAARHRGAERAGFDVRAEGVGAAPSRMVFYGSSETHGWARKAAELLGLGANAFRKVPVDDAYRVRVVEMARMIDADRAAGLIPFCIVGTAGTVNTGATDDLAALADLARDRELWFHVDGAFGALARLSPALAPIVAGLERADSLAFDLHKWGYLPFECACVLVRDPAAHRAAFAAPASYLAETARGVIAGGLPFADRGVDLTRGFKALKVWMSFRAHGVDAFAALIEQNVAHVRHLVALIDAHDDLELLAPAPLNVCCFRWTRAGLDDARLNRINEETLLRLQERGLAVPSGATIGGRFAIRVAHVNHRTRLEDMDALVADVRRIGSEVAGEIA